MINTGGTRGRRRRAWPDHLPPRDRSLLVLQQHSEPEAEPDLSVAASVAAQAREVAVPDVNRVPTSTYRLQITPSFDLYAAARWLPYLHDLGVDWVYLSPLLEAEAGSEHGYDVVRPRPGRPGARRRRGAGRALGRGAAPGMGVLVDIVPNHVGVATPEANPWWADVLEHGRESAYAGFFDVDWDAGGGVAPDRARTSTTGGSSPSTRWPGSGSRSVRSSTPATSRSGAGSTKGSSTGCGWTTRTACSTPGLPRRPGGADRWRLRAGGEDPRTR